MAVSVIKPYKLKVKCLDCGEIYKEVLSTKPPLTSPKTDEECVSTGICEICMEQRR